MATLTIMDADVDNVSIGQPASEPIPGKQFRFRLEDAAGRILEVQILRTDGTRPTLDEIARAAEAAAAALRDRDGLVGATVNITTDLGTKRDRR